MALIPEPSISIPSWEGRGMEDTDVSSLKLVGEDIVGTKPTTQDTELDELDAECMMA
jgi:hypothetical protein